jgi:hypothetical protein
MVFVLAFMLFGTQIWLTVEAFMVGLICGTCVLVGLLIGSNIFGRRVGIEMNRYRCSRCRYVWVVEELRPEQLRLIARKIEADLPHLRRTGKQRALLIALVALGETKLNLDDERAGVRLSEEGLELARTIGHKLCIALTLNNLALAAIFCGNHERSRSLVEETWNLAHELGNWELVAVCMNNLGFAALDSGDDQQAGQLFADALRIRQKLCHRAGLSWPIAGLAEVAAARRQTARAATLCAMAQAVVDDAGVPFVEGMRRRQGRAITAARAVLGETAFAAAWAEGRMMPQNKAIDYALSVIHQNEV